MSKSGIILVVLGCLFLANNFGLLEWGWLRQWWPMILIGVGIWSILDNRRGDSPPSRDGNKLP
jgi:LiaI-LiaF-like transmembrane region